MPTKVTMPKLGLTMKTGTVVEWIIREGEPVEKGKPLYSIDTQKVITEIESPASGILRKIVAPEGTTAPIGSLLAVITDANEAIPDVDRLIREATTAPTEQIAVGQAGTTEPASVVASGISDKVPISPSARKLAREHSIDVSKLTGTGHGGRIQREDVLKAIEGESGGITGIEG